MLEECHASLICRQWGGIEQLQIGEAPMPRPGREEVLIGVKTTAVNYADGIMVAGSYQTKPELPFRPGL
jgi:NADPH2:quinone reductase